MPQAVSAAGAATDSGSEASLETNPLTASTRGVQTSSAAPNSNAVAGQLFTAAAPLNPAPVPPVMAATPSRTVVPTAINSAFAPLLGDGTPQAPVNSPVSWMVMAAALGQIGQGRSGAPGAARKVQASAAVTPALVAGTPVVLAPNVRTGIVYGGAAFTNTAGGTLSFTAPATSTGGGAVSVNSSTGAFTYTPTQSQRQNAGLNTTDTFTVTASNGNLSAFQTITVPVDPGTPVAGTPWVRTPVVASGVVTGTAKFTDGSGRTLTYSATSTSSGGAGVSINANTGDFTYTPTAGQRQNADLSTTDTFTVTVTNGVRTTTQSVTVAVDPGTPVAGSPWVRTPSTGTGVVSGIAKFTDGSGRTLTYSTPSTSAAGGAVSINASTGDFTYTPTVTQRRNAGANSTDSFTVSVNNGVRTTTQTVTVSVDPGTPVANAPWIRTPNAGTGVVTGIAKGIDSVGGSVTYSVASTSAGGGAVTINSATGDFTFTPTQAQRQNAGPSTTDSFAVTISNGGRTTTQAITVAVDPGTPSATTPWLRAPVVASGVVTGVAKGTDSVGGPLTFSAPSTSPGGAAVSINAATGDFTYTPTQAQRRSAGLSTTDSFTVTISNGGRTTTRVITVPVDPGTPVAGTPWVRTPNAGTGVVTGIAKFTDGSGRTLVYSAPNTSTGGGAVTIDANTGDFTYTPTLAMRQNAGANTTDTFTITAVNGVRNATQTVTVAVDPGTPVAGVATVGAANVNTGLVTGSARATDSIGRTLSYSTGGTSAGGGQVSVNSSTGAFTYTPNQSQRQNAGLNTTDSFAVAISNGARTITQTVTVGVDPGTPVAGSPTVGAPAAQTGAVTGRATASDSVGGPLTFTAGRTSTGGGTVNINPNTGDFTYTPTGTQRRNAGLSTTDSFTVTISNGARTTTQTVSVAVDPGTPLPSPVTMGTPSIWTGLVSGTARFTDGSGRTLTYSTAGTSTGGATVTVNAATGAYTYTPTLAMRQNADLSTTDTFTVSATNGLRTTSQTVTVSVDPGAPWSNTPWVRAADGTTGAVTGLAKFTETIGRTLTYSTSGTSNGGGTVSLNTSTGAFVYTPTQGQRQNAGGNTTDTFSVTASNGLRTTTQTITVPVNPNSAPVVANLSLTNGAGGVIEGTVTATDANSDPLTFTAGTPSRGTLTSFDSATGAFTFTPTTGERHAAALNNAASGDRTASFTLTANDGRGGVTPYAVTLNISPLNSDPTGSGSLGAPSQNSGQASGSLVYTDADTDTLTYSVASGPSKGSVVFDGNGPGTFTYTPTWNARHAAAADGVGPQTDSFTLAVDDSHGGRVTVPFTVDIVPVNTALSQTATVGPADPYTASMQVSLADPDGDALTYTVVTGPNKGTLTVNGWNVTYTPDRSVSHPIAAGAPSEDDTFTLTVNDGHGSTVTIPVTVTIGPANYAPAFATLAVATPDAQTGQVSGSITATDQVDDDPRTYVVSRGPVNGGSVTINASTGAFTYTPSAAGRQDAAAASTGVGVFAGKWGRYQLMTASRGNQGCNQTGGVCQVSGFGEPNVDNYWWNWNYGNQPTWNTGDYVKLVDTGRTMWGGQPDLALIQYTSNGIQKQVIAASGYIDSIGDGILYTGAAGNTQYYISNSMGIGRYAQGSYSFVVDYAYPNRSQLAGYVASTSPLDIGQVLATTDTFTVEVSDGHGGTISTTISVPILPAQGG